MTYEEQLQTPEWQAKRLQILKRDGFKCRRCEGTRGLQVHHVRYEPGRLAWEYTHDYFVTLCDKHHAEEHGKRPPPESPASIGDIIAYHYGPKE